MRQYLARRALMSVPVLLMVSALAFFGQELIPGDTLTTFFGANLDADVTQEQVEALEREFGLDKPLPVRYVVWLGDVLTGDFGISLRSGRPVAEIIFEKLGVSLWITSVTLVMNIAVGVALGVIAGMRPGSRFDLGATFIATYGIATPNFWMAILLILLFSVKLGWFPASGWVSPLEDPMGALHHLVLPVMALGMLGSASIMRQTRSALVEVMAQDYVRTAKSKGLAHRTIVIRHALRNALIPTVTVAAFQVSGLVAGSVLVERVFAIPGIGRLAVDATENGDFPVIQMIVLLSAVAIVFANFAADVLYAVLDPRITYQ